MNLIFDLDGTLIDSSNRMYTLFQELVPQSNLTKEEYWGLKRDKVNHKKLLEKFYPEVDFEDFNSRWMSMIEEERFLIMDTNYPDTVEVLDTLARKNKLYLLTARQSEEGLKKELNRLGLDRFFTEILTTAGKTPKDVLLDSFMDSNPKTFCSDDWFISDMGADILTGKSKGFRTIGITHGFMNDTRLKEYAPDYIVNELRELVSIIGHS